MNWPRVSILGQQQITKVARVMPFGCRKRLRLFFSGFGCMRCRRKNVRYGGSGVCEDYSGRVSTLLRLSMKRHQNVIQADTIVRLRPISERYIERVDRAEELLADFRSATKKGLRSPSAHPKPKTKKSPIPRPAVLVSVAKDQFSKL